jgi:hypothetical protein
MSLFRKRQRQTPQIDDPREEEIQAIRQQTLDKADRATESADKLIRLLDSDTLGITGRIFYATGGDKRNKK